MTEHSHADFATMKSLFDSKAKLSISSWLSLTKKSEAVELSRGSTLQQIYFNVSHIYFLTSGVAQEFIELESGKNIIRAFHMAPAVVGNLSDYKRHSISRHNVTMIEEGSAMRIPCQTLIDLMSECPDLERWFLINMSQALLKHQHRLQSLLQLENEQRLEAFFSDQPELASTLSSQHISEYLNVPAVIVNIVRKGYKKASKQREHSLMSA
ncbi:Crp/Fnr family transcriptional regulator [Aurantivibrio plasticivorans]